LALRSILYWQLVEYEAAISRREACCPPRHSAVFCASSRHEKFAPAVNHPDSLGIPGFFVVVFSVVTQFDVRPVGWYN